MTDKKLIEYSIIWFNEIVERLDRMTTGNFAHNKNQIRGFAKNCSEFIKKHEVKEEQK